MQQGDHLALSINAALPIVEEALNYRAMRQDMIASNISNVDTPNYRPRDVDFESMLAEKKAKIFNEPKDRLQLANTSATHLQAKPDALSTEAKLFFRDGHMAKNDGNSVDLDVETTEMAKNSQMYNALTASLKKGVRIYVSVLDASAKV